MSELIVRSMLPEEIPQVARLHLQIHALHVNGRPDLFVPSKDDASGLINWHFQQPNKLILVAVKGDSVVGYAINEFVKRDANPYTKARRTLHVEEICVDENCKRCGAGRALMEAIYEEARKRCYPRVELDVWDFNDSARQFYHAIGMSEFRHFLEYQALPYTFAKVTESMLQEATNLYDSLKGLPGCTWDEGYPNQDVVASDIENGFLHGVFDGDELIAIGAALPDNELTHLDFWRIPAENPCVLSRIGVKQNRQGQGLAGQMVRYMEEEMRLAGYDVARMLVSPGNEKALRAYRGCGYQECGSTRMYEEDWLCFEKKLS